MDHTRLRQTFAANPLKCQLYWIYSTFNSLDDHCVSLSLKGYIVLLFNAEDQKIESSPTGNNCYCCFNGPLLHFRARRCPTPSRPSTAQPRWKGWEPPRPTWCRSELALLLDTDATATPWTSAPAFTVRKTSLLLLFLMICCYSFLNEGSSLEVVIALISSHHTCSTGHPLIS